MKYTTGFFSLFVLVSCEVAGPVLNPTIGQLEEAKTLAANGDYAAIARTTVTCSPEETGCAQLRAIRASACRQVAANDCAIVEYQAALAAARARSDRQADPATLRLGLLEAIHAKRDAGRGAAVDRSNRNLLDEAIRAQADPATRTAGYYYAANAKLFATLQSPSPGGCDSIRQAASDLASAKTTGTPLEANGQTLAQAIANARSARGCVT